MKAIILLLLITPWISGCIPGHSFTIENNSPSAKKIEVVAAADFLTASRDIYPFRVDRLLIGDVGDYPYSGDSVNMESIAINWIDSVNEVRFSFVLPPNKEVVVEGGFNGGGFGLGTYAEKIIINDSDTIKVWRSSFIFPRTSKRIKQPSWPIGSTYTLSL